MKSHTKIFLFYIGYVTIRFGKITKYLKINSVNPLNLIINKMNGYVEEISKNKYLMLVPTNESKEVIQKYEELLSKIKDLISSMTKTSGDYKEQYVKIKFNLDDELHLIK